MKLMIINGPNLNLLGKRETDVYGSADFATFLNTLRKRFPSVEIHYFQSNVEGEIINKLHETGLGQEEFKGIILNAGAYTHTSVAIADAVAAINTPVVEVHISNIFAREDYRHVSYVGAKCKGSISGFGLSGYTLAVTSFLNQEQ